MVEKICEINAFFSPFIAPSLLHSSLIQSKKKLQLYIPYRKIRVISFTTTRIIALVVYHITLAFVFVISNSLSCRCVAKTYS